MKNIEKDSFIKLEKQKNNLEYAQKISKLGSWTLYIKNNDLIWSDEIFNIFELNKEKFEASYEAFLDAIHPEDRILVNNTYLEALKNKTPYTIEHRLLMKDGRIKWVVENCETEYDKKGEPLISYGTVQDITKEHQLSEQLEKSTKELKNIQKALSDYVSYIRLNKEKTIIDVSNAFCKLSEYSKDEIIGNSCDMFFHPKINEKTIETMWDDINTKSLWKGEIRAISKLKKSFWLDVSISPEYNEEKELIGYVSIHNDITTKKDFEKQQVQLFGQSKMASMGEMLANISHQWRQPLSAISSISTGLKLKHDFSQLEEEDLITGLDKINNYTQYLSKTIDTFRDFLKDNKVSKTICLQNEIRNTLQILKTALENKYIKLIDELDNVEPININLIPDELSQVIINIVTNSKDALLEKKIEEPYIKISMKSTSKTILVSIEDNAKGIPKDILPRIFEPYFTTKHKNQGTGLGLYMSHKIVTESLKGYLNVKNTKDGVCFTIELPYDK